MLMLMTTKSSTPNANLCMIALEILKESRKWIFILFLRQEDFSLENKHMLILKTSINS